MVTVNAHYDGKTIVLDEPFSLPLKPGTRLKVNVQPLADSPTATQAPRRFEPLDIHLAPELAKEIGSNPEFNIEES